MPVTWIDRELNVELAHVVFLEKIEYVTDEDYEILEQMRSTIADSDKWPFDEWPVEEGEEEKEKEEEEEEEEDTKPVIIGSNLHQRML